MGVKSGIEQREMSCPHYLELDIGKSFISTSICSYFFCLTTLSNTSCVFVYNICFEYIVHFIKIIDMHKIIDAAISLIRICINKN